MKKYIQQTNAITVVGNIILSVTVAAILILFFTQGNGRWIANFIINS